MILSEKEKRVVLAVFGELMGRKYAELDTFLGSETIIEMQTLYSKLRHEEYCERKGIAYEEMTEDDFIEAAEERYDLIEAELERYTE